MTRSVKKMNKPENPILHLPFTTLHANPGADDNSPREGGIVWPGERTVVTSLLNRPSRATERVGIVREGSAGETG